MEGTDPGDKVRGTYWEALKKNWMLWPAVQAVNFRFVPLEHRVLVVNVVSLGELISFHNFFFFLSFFFFRRARWPAGKGVEEKSAEENFG